jgi:hypothetical protein
MVNSDYYQSIRKAGLCMLLCILSKTASAKAEEIGIPQEKFAHYATYFMGRVDQLTAKERKDPFHMMGLGGICQSGSDDYDFLRERAEKGKELVENIYVQAAEDTLDEYLRDSVEPRRKVIAGFLGITEDEANNHIVKRTRVSASASLSNGGRISFRVQNVPYVGLEEVRLRIQKDGAAFGLEKWVNREIGLLADAYVVNRPRGTDYSVGVSAPASSLFNDNEVQGDVEARVGSGSDRGAYGMISGKIAF